MAPIRVLQIVTRLAVRGVPRHVLNLAAGLDPERFDVEVLAGRSEAGEGDLWEEAGQRGIKTVRVESLQRPVRPGADLAALAAIYRHIRAGDYDIVHTHISKAGLLGRLAARRAGVKVVVHTYHGRVSELHDGSLKSRLFRLCERRAAAWSDALVAVSEATERQLLQSGIGSQRQFRVIRNSIDLHPFLSYPPAAASAGLRLVCVASLTPEKGIDVLLKALATLAERWPRLSAEIVNDGPLRPALERQAAELGLAARVRFTGLVGDVRPHIAAADIFALPSQSEGLPTALLEAMAMGRAVVASRTGGVPEAVVEGETGLLVEPGDAGALAGAIEALLADGALRQRLGAAGRARVEREFALEKMIGQVEALYAELLGEGGW